MEHFVQNIKKKLTDNNIIDMMKEAKVIDEDIKEQEVRNALSKIDPNNELSIEEMASKLSDCSSSKPAPSKSTTQVVVAKAKSGINAVQKFTSSEEKTKKEDETYPYVKEENIFGLYDDFR